MKKPSFKKTQWDEFIISDLHLTESKDDDYKWDVFPWTLKVMEKEKIETLIIMGDILDKKDRHPSKLINRLISNLMLLVAEGIEIKILMGNHDYIAESSPFLEFVNSFPMIEYITTVKEDGTTLWLPHTRTPMEDWKQYHDSNFEGFERIFMHQSIIGSKTSQFYTIEHGLPSTYFSTSAAQIFSGDIHIPQKINDVFYIGTPYPVHYGDHYKGCGVFIKGTATERLFRDTIRKESLRITSVKDLKDYELKPDDRIKIDFTLEGDEVHKWAEYKQEIEEFCKENKIHIKSINLKKADTVPLDLENDFEVSKKTHEELFEEFCTHVDIPDATKAVGFSILKQIRDVL